MGTRRRDALLTTIRQMPSGRFARSLSLSAAIVVSLAAPSVAGAHLRSGTVAVDYRAQVFHAQSPAYTARIFQSDRGLGLTVEPGHVVVLVGYLGEPVFRLDGRGLWINGASPTAVTAGLIKRSDRALAATPRWRLQPKRRSVVWHDGRVQGLPAGVGRGDWSVPLIVDGRRLRLSGDLERFGAPALWLWLGILAVLLAGGAVSLLLGPRDRIAAFATGFAVAGAAAAVVVLLALALDAYASPGTWIEAIDAVAFLAAAMWVLFRGPEEWRIAGAIGAGLVAVAVGLLEGAVFLHPIVLAIMPSAAARFACVVALGAGVDAVAIGGLVYARRGLPTSLKTLEQRAPRAGS
jgi:hypothetical protein